MAHGRGELAAAEAAYGRAAERFERAGERGGRDWLAANLAGLAVETGALTRGLRSGRSALRGLLARGQLQALDGLAVNLGQLLLRVGAVEEAAALERLCAEVVRGPLAEARLARLAADRLRAAGAGRPEVERRYAACAAALGPRRRPARRSTPTSRRRRWPASAAATTPPGPTSTPPSGWSTAPRRRPTRPGSPPGSRPSPSPPASAIACASTGPRPPSPASPAPTSSAGAVTSTAPGPTTSPSSRPSRSRGSASRRPSGRWSAACAQPWRASWRRLTPSIAPPSATP
ncbi:MAG: hypothetical protein H6711_09060 [Myxococcales bacterium]|nr:hypothetical protein [Myxococcales bacterium]